MQQADLIKHLSRANRIIQARAVSDEEANRVESEVILEVLGASEQLNELAVCTGGVNGFRAFEATEIAGKALQRALMKLAKALDVKAPRAGTYDPLFASAKTLRDLWRLRQVIDQLSIPYDFYVDAAAQYWVEGQKKRMPRVSQGWLLRPSHT